VRTLYRANVLSIDLETNDLDIRKKIDCRFEVVSVQLDAVSRLIQQLECKDMQLQSEFMKELLANAQKQMQQMSSTTEAKDKF
jgi:hypothetical protein